MLNLLILETSFCFQLLWAEISECLWDGVSENGDLSYVFDETTPVKACGDLAYHVTCGGKDFTPSSNPSIRFKYIIFFVMCVHLYLV